MLIDPMYRLCLILLLNLDVKPGLPNQIWITNREYNFVDLFLFHSTLNRSEILSNRKFRRKGICLIVISYECHKPPSFILKPPPLILTSLKKRIEDNRFCIPSLNRIIS